MRCQANTKRAALLWPWLLLASASGAAFAGGPTDGVPATACLRLESRLAVPGTTVCSRLLYLRNSCDVHVAAEVLRTQHLFSGTLRQAFPVIVPAGGEQSLGCAWWRGAMAASEHRLLAARFLVAPDRPGPAGRRCSTRR